MNDIKYGNSTAKFLFTILKAYANENGVAFPSLKTLSIEIEASLSTVQRGLKTLIDNGHIEKVPNPKGYVSTAYKLSTGQNDDLVNMTTTTQNDLVKVTKTMVNMTTNKENKNKIKKRYRFIVDKWLKNGGRLGTNYEQRLQQLTDSEIEEIKQDLKIRIDYKLTLFSYLAFKKWHVPKVKDQFNYNTNQPRYNRAPNKGGHVVEYSAAHIPFTEQELPRKAKPAAPTADFFEAMKKAGIRLN